MARKYPARSAGTPTKPGKSVVDQRSQKAWRSVRQLTQMLPSLTSFARAMTNDPSVRVQLGDHGAQTDGKNIWLFPPIALGEELVHTPGLCDKRGNNKRQLCQACDAREQIIYDLFHEIAHVSFNTMVTPSERSVQTIIDLINDWHPEDACGHASELVMMARKAATPLELAYTHNPFLLVLVKALEDARVNARMFEARRGTKVMFDAGVLKIFEEGVETKDGEHHHWRDAPLNAQINIGLLLVASGYGMPEGFLSDKAVEVVSDSELMRLALQAIGAEDVHQIMSLAVAVFLRLNELGYMEVERCIAPPPAPPAPPSLGKPGDEENSANQSTDSDDDPDDGDGDSGSPSTEPDGDPTDSSGEGESSDSADTTESTDPSESDGSDQPESDGSGDPGDSAAGGNSGGSESTEGHEDQSDDDAGTTPGEVGESDGSDDPDFDDDEYRSSDGDRSDTAEDSDSDRASDEGGDDVDSEDASSPDDVLRGSDSNHRPPEDQDGSAGGQPTGRASDPHGGDAEDCDSASPEGSTEVEVEGGSDSSDGDDEGGRESSDEAASDSRQDQPEDSGDNLPDDIWADESNAIAAAQQWDKGDSQPPQVDEYGEPVNINESNEDGEPVYFGTPEEVMDALRKFGSLCDKHEVEAEKRADKKGTQKEKAELSAVALAMQQGAHFDSMRTGVEQLLVLQHPMPGLRWYTNRRKIEDFEPTRGLMGRATMEARLAFEDNKRAKETRNLKDGKLDSRAIGKRAPLGDPRMFLKRNRPGKKDYFFAIGLDISGSTDIHGRNERIVKAAFAQAELLSRLGHKFAIYGMTGGRDISNVYSDNYTKENDVWVFEVKKPNEPWTRTTKQKLVDLQACAENYDGHNLEFLRKVLDGRNEVSRGIIYYTDGEMPAANPNEELRLINDELATCKKKSYTVLAVGINTDSPRRYGLNTVQVDSDADLVKVTKQLGAYLAQS